MFTSFALYFRNFSCGGSCNISYQSFNLSVWIRSITTSACGSASCHVGSCTGCESAIISILHLQPFQSSGQNRLHGPKSLPPSYICPPALCPSPPVLGTVGVGVHFREGMTPGSGSKGGWRAWKSGDGQWRVEVAIYLVRILLKITFSGLKEQTKTDVAFGENSECVW